MEWNSRFLIFAIYGNAKDEWNSAESKRSMAEDAVLSEFWVFQEKVDMKVSAFSFTTSLLVFGYL